MTGSCRYFRPIGFMFLCVSVATLPVVLAGNLDGDLRKAAEKGDIGKIQDLLARGADINAVDGRGRSALFKAAEKGRLDAVRLLVKAGADPIKESAELEKALREAAEKGKQENIQCLLEAGVNPNAEEKGSRTALIRAAEKGKWDAVKLLQESGGQGGYFILYEKKASNLLKELAQASALGFRVLWRAETVGSDARVAPVIILEQSADSQVAKEYYPPAQPHASIQKELYKFSEKGFRFSINGTEADPEQRYLYLTDSDFSRMQEKLDRASALGFRVLMASSQHKVKGDSELAVILERSVDPENPHEYCLMDAQRVHMEKELNSIAGKGFRLLPNTLTTRSIWTSACAGCTPGYATSGVCLLEKGGQSTKDYKYEVLSGNPESFLEDMRLEIAEARERGYFIVAIRNSWQSTGKLLVFMEKEIE